MASKRYELVESLGTGGMATVWRARDTVLDRWVALKRLLPHANNDPVVSERFRREALSSARLSHPGIVTVYDAGEDEDGPFIVLELVEGETLGDLLKREGSLDVAATAGIVRQVADALDYAHSQGVIHRDVKPANLMIASDGTVQLTDFGIARSADDPTTITKPGAVIGTLAYLAPEVIEGDMITSASDIYSLGAVTYQMLTGDPPFRAENVGALVIAIRTGDAPKLDGIPDAVAETVLEAMSTDPTKRPATAGEFAANLMARTTLAMPAETVVMPPVTTTAEVSEVPDNPTLVIPATGDAAPPGPSRRAAWVAVLLVAGVALTAFAMMPDGTGPGLATATSTTAILPAETTTTAPITTSTTTTTTTTTTTPTTTTTTTTIPTPESVAEEMAIHVEELDPPEYRSKDIKRVSDALDAVMSTWADGDEEELTDQLQNLGEAIQDLPDTEETDHLMDHFVELVELMGFELRANSDEDDD
ncbi:MAG: serine/threonine-protein kinase [Acidimicrobiia bacterium]